jgi:hypothetical protein
MANWNSPRSLTLSGGVSNGLSGPMTFDGRELFTHEYIKARLDMADYPTGITVSDAEMKELSLQREGFHGEWNYRLFPKAPKSSSRATKNRT